MLSRIFLYLLTFYAILTLYAYFFADKQIFLQPKSSYQDNNQILKIPSKNNTLISAIYLPNPEAKYTLLVSHGNAEDLGTMLPFLKLFQAQGYAVFAYDYEGYGTSQGKPTEKNAYMDVNAAYNYLTTQLQVDPKHIIAYGRSVGAALAIDLAAHRAVAGLIVESPFTSAFRVALPFPLLFFDKFNNLAKISKVSCPILVIHGTRDEVIPFSHGEKLYQAAPTAKTFYSVTGAGHNNMLQVAGDKYWQTIKTFTQSLQTENSSNEKKR